MYISRLSTTMSCISLLFLLLSFFLLHPPPAAAAAAAVVGINFFSKVCGSTGNYTANSTYQSNLDSLFSFLASNASASPSGFADTTLGRIPDAVSGLALCRGDANATTCRSCLGLAAQDGPELCPATKGAILWYDPCLVQYSNQNFLSSTTNSPLVIGVSSQNITGPGTGQFDKLVNALMTAVADRAANDTKKRFATGEVTNFTDAFPTIYGLEQCTPDLSASDCRQCLGDLIGEMPQYFAGRQGGRIVGVRCNLRYEVYSFYGGAPSLTLSSAAAEGPAPPPADVGPPIVNPSTKDSEKRGWLDWGKRYKIINGIARGLLYLHEDSQLKVVHRDLKASNILLDAEMNPKISDFGLARLFGGDHSQEVTRRVVGTFGYMAPEYAMHGYFSNKSDVFSFGIMVLELVTGRKNAGSFNSEQAEDLVNYTWENWKKGTITEIVDSSLGKRYPRSEVLRCIHIGLLCVQENPADRPNMSRVVVMLSSNTVTLETPSKPAFCIGMSSMQYGMYSNGSKYHGTSSKSVPSSPNEVSITELDPR